jgi:hypothetical protein
MRPRSKQRRSGKPDNRAAIEGSRDDQRWFSANPTRTHRLRRALPSERYSDHGGRPATHICVRQIMPGFRYRVGIVLPEAPPDSEALAHALFDMAAESLAAGDRFVSLTSLYERALRMAQGGRA